MAPPLRSSLVNQFARSGASNPAFTAEDGDDRPGGYKFSDYPRLGLPLTVIILVMGTLLIVQVWPLAR